MIIEVSRQYDKNQVCSSPFIDTLYWELQQMVAKVIKARPEQTKSMALNFSFQVLTKSGASQDSIWENKVSIEGEEKEKCELYFEEDDTFLATPVMETIAQTCIKNIPYLPLYVKGSVDCLDKHGERIYQHLYEINTKEKN